MEAVEVASDIDQQIESRRLLGVIGRIGVWHVCNVKFISNKQSIHILKFFYIGVQ
jgi:hypothetical protein